MQKEWVTRNRQHPSRHFVNLAFKNRPQSVLQLFWDGVHFSKTSLRLSWAVSKWPHSTLQKKPLLWNNNCRKHMKMAQFSIFYQCFSPNARIIRLYFFLREEEKIFWEKDSQLTNIFSPAFPLLRIKKIAKVCSFSLQKWLTAEILLWKLYTLIG